MNGLLLMNIKKREKETMTNIKTSHPTKCVLWKTENLSIDQLRQILEVITIYEDDSHLIRKLLRCKECGHLYFREFYEGIDWSEGKDAQYMTWIRVDDAESGERRGTEQAVSARVAVLSKHQIRLPHGG
jgi:hypothetical protein